VDGAGSAYIGLNTSVDRPRFDVQVSNAGPDAIVSLIGSSLSYTVPGAAGQWLLLDLAYDPTTAQASLKVEGVQRLPGYPGWAGSRENRGVLFGASSATGSFNLVRLQLATESTKVPQEPLVITGAPTNAPMGTFFVVGTTGGSGTGAVSFNTTGACSNVSGGAQIMMTGASGACEITATKAGDDLYLPVTSATVTVAATAAVDVLTLSPSALSLPPASEGTMTVSISSARAQDVVVSIVSSEPAVVSVPETATIPAGQTGATFVAGASETTGTSTITAMASGASPATATVAVVNATLDILETTAALAAGIPGSVSVRLQGSGTVVSVPAGGVAYSAQSTNPTCVAVLDGVLPAGALSTPVAITYGGTATLPCTGTVTISSQAFGVDSAVVTVYPAEVVYSATGSLSYYNPAPVPTPDGRGAAGTANVSYYNPAPVPPPDGIGAARPASVSYYNPAPVPNPAGTTSANVAAVSYYNPAIAVGTESGALATSVSIANGPAATALEPVQLSRSAGTVRILTISGAALTGANQVTLVGYEGVIVAGAPIVSEDGRLLTVDVFVPANTPLGQAYVVVSGQGWSTAQVPSVRVEIVQ
jgi:hypothetical protein